MCGAVVAGASASSSAPGKAEAAAAKRPKAPVIATLGVRASVAPNLWLKGADVTVYDRHGVHARGVTNAVGALSVPVAEGKKADWPLRIATDGGTVNGRPFGGHLEAYAWDPGPVWLNLWPTAAARLVDRPGKNLASEANWVSAVEKVQAVLGIPDALAPRVLEGGNFYVDGGRLAAEVEGLGGFGSDAYDQLASAVASAASEYKPTKKPKKKPKKKDAVPSLGLAPLSSSITTAGPSLIGGTLGDSSGSAPCGAITPDTPTSSGKSTGFWVATGLGAAAGLAYDIFGGAEVKIVEDTVSTLAGRNRFVDTLTAGYYAGTVFAWTESTGESADSAQLSAIQDQLTCISAQVAAVQDAVDELSNATTLDNIFGAGSQAANCAEEVGGSGGAWDEYESLVRNAIPVSVALAAPASAGATSIVVPTAYGANFSTGATVTGAGIPPLYLGGNKSGDPSQPATTYPTSLGFAEGSYTVQLLSSVWSGLGSAFATAQLRGQRVSGPGIGVNADGSAATVLGVSEFSGVTTLTLSAPATSAGAKGAKLTFAGPNIVVSTPRAVTGGYAVSLSAPTTGTVTSLSVSQSLDVANALLPGTIDTFDVGSCVGVVNDALFARQPSGPTGFAALLAEITAGSNGTPGSTMTPGQVSEIQSFLQYWGLVEAQALMLGAEYENFYGDVGGAVETLSGFAPLLTVGGWPVCWKNADPGSACVAANNLAAAWPDTLYSDEIGQTGSSIAVNAFPGGLVVPPVAGCAALLGCTRPWKLNRGETTLTPATWLTLYWSLGANPACVPEQWYFSPSIYPFPPVQTNWLLPKCGSASSFSSTVWSNVAVNGATIGMSGSQTLSPGIYWGDSLVGVTDTASGCFLGRPYYASARCQFNALGYNPGGYDSPSTAYPNGSVSFTAAAPVLTAAAPHDLAAGDVVKFWADSAGLPIGVSAGTAYYVLSAGLTDDTFEIAATVGGTPVVPGGSCPGTCYFYSTAPKQVMVPNTTQNYRSPKAAHTVVIDLAKQPDLLAPASTRATTAQTAALLSGMQCGSPGASTVKVSSSGGSALFTTTVSHGLAVGEPLVFTTSAGGNVTAGEVYYVVGVPTSFTFLLSTSAGGTAKVPYKAAASSVSYLTTQCPSWTQQPTALLAKTKDDAGFFSNDGSVTQYLWSYPNASAVCQGNQIFEYPQQYAYAYNSYKTTTNGATSGSGILRLPTSQSELKSDDLRNKLPAFLTCNASTTKIDPPHSCWAQGALQTNLYERTDGYGKTATGPSSGDSWSYSCDTPFYYNTDPGFNNQTNDNTLNYDAKRFDSFVLGRTWWPTLGSLLEDGPPAPLEAACADPDCDDYTLTSGGQAPAASTAPTSVLVSPKIAGAYTVAWDQPADTGFGAIVRYAVVATNGWTCEVAGTGPVIRTSAKTFATCTGGTGTPSVTVTAVNTFGASATAPAAAPA